MEFVINANPNNDLVKLSNKSIDKSFEKEIYHCKQLAEMLHTSGSPVFDPTTKFRAKELGFTYISGSHKAIDAGTTVFTVYLQDEFNRPKIRVDFYTNRYVHVVDRTKAVIKFTKYYFNL